MFAIALVCASFYLIVACPNANAEYWLGLFVRQFHHPKPPPALRRYGLEAPLLAAGRFVHFVLPAPSYTEMECGDKEACIGEQCGGQLRVRQG